MGRIGAAELFIVIAIILCTATVLVVVPWWFIFRKSGNPPPLALLMVLPLVNIVMLFWFAFSEWPIEKQARRPTAP